MSRQEVTAICLVPKGWRWQERGCGIVGTLPGNPEIPSCLCMLAQWFFIQYLCGFSCAGPVLVFSQVHINRHKATGAGRLVMRMRGVLKLLLNTPIFPTTRQGKVEIECRSMQSIVTHIYISKERTCAGMRKLGRSLYALLVWITRSLARTHPWPACCKVTECMLLACYSMKAKQDSAVPTTPQLGSSSSWLATGN